VSAPVVEEVVEVVHPLGQSAVRVRWSDGTEGVALRYYRDEILISEGDLVGKTQDEIRALHFRRDREWLQS
jgi:hypothetical protein